MSAADEPQPPGDDLALDFLEQWLAEPTLGATPVSSGTSGDTTPRSSDPSLRSIELLVAQHKDLFRRHTSPPPGPAN